MSDVVFGSFDTGHVKPDAVEVSCNLCIVSLMFQILVRQYLFAQSY